MFRVIANGDKLLHADNVYDKHKLYSATISREINKPHTFNFSIPYMHEYYKNIAEKKTTITVTGKYSGAEKLQFDGYVLKAQEYMDSSGKVYKQVVCESCLGYLYDSVQPYTEYPIGSSYADIISGILENHNTTFSDTDYEHKRIPTFEILSPSRAIAEPFAVTYDNTYNVLQAFIKAFGGEMLVTRTEDGSLKLLYSETEIVPETAGEKPKIELARNMQAIDRSVDGSKVITRLYGYGKKIPDSAGKETEERYPMTSPGYIEAPTAKETYGLICGTQIFDQYTDGEQIRLAAMKWLDQNNIVSTSYNITALDLSTIGLDFNTFELGGWYEVSNELLGISTELRVIKISTDINAPQKSSLTIGSVQQSITALTTKADKLEALIPQQIQEAASTAANKAEQNTDEKLKDYLQAQTAADTYVDKSVMYSYPTKAEVNTALSYYELTSDLNTKLAGYDLKTDTLQASRLMGTATEITLNGVTINNNGSTKTEINYADITLRNENTGEVYNLWEKIAQLETLIGGGG